MHCLKACPGWRNLCWSACLGESLHLTFKRIQFTPDLMPSDITGTEVIQEESQSGGRGYKFLPGPVFANLVLADEINRTPPKTQAAMLEAMQERQVTAGGRRIGCPRHFSSWPRKIRSSRKALTRCPSAFDRFLLYVKVDYPSGAEEWEVARRVTTGRLGRDRRRAFRRRHFDYQQFVTRVPVSDQVLGYAWVLVRSSRPQTARRLTS